MTWLHNALNWIIARPDHAIRSLYYAVLFGLEGPLTARLAARVREIERQRAESDTPATRETWDSQYQSGRWSFLRGPFERPRSTTIAEYLNRLKPGGAVCDVGCGDGLLFEYLREGGARPYLGVDISLAAIMRGREVCKADVFICANAETYIPDAPYDAIVFNESLYYFEEPLDVLARYASILSPDGIIIVSTYLGSCRARAILRAIRQRYRLIEDTQLEAPGEALRWNCAVFARIGLPNDEPEDDSPRKGYNADR